jgi:lipid II:glycine glycyltransferase (peptidoglycan interpeptide bridge formation enzyme)
LVELSVTSAADLDGVDAQEYEAFVRESPSGHASQSIEWAEVARAGAHVASRFYLARSAGRLVGVALMLRPEVAGVGLPWGWIERGPVVAHISDLRDVTEAIARAALAQGILRLRVMPYWANEDARHAEEQLRAVGFRDAYKPDGAHACTIRIDIGGKTDDELFAGNSKSQIRWRAKQAEKAGARARAGTPEDWARLRAMHRRLMESQGRNSRPPGWWSAIERFVTREGRGALFACDFDARVVSAGVMLRHGRRATYAWGASVEDKLPFSKAIPPLIAGIRWARDLGCTCFDLGGIPLEGDDDPKRNAIALFKFDFDKRRVPLVREHVAWCPRVGRSR